jgi:trans-AT polyketide synthase/acyltransferase/oxidoreductase domain-containing protein
MKSSVDTAAQLTACFTSQAIAHAVMNTRAQANILAEIETGRRGVALSEAGTDPQEIARQYSQSSPTSSRCSVIGMLSPLYPEWLGDRSFLDVHGVRFPYIAGEMANGIAGPRLVVAMARANMLAFFGAAGLDPSRVEDSIRRIQADLGDSGLAWGANLIHTPSEPELENVVADLYLRLGVHRVCASAYIRPTPAVVRYACAGLRAEPSGAIRRANHLFAKLSRTEVARQFLSPAPQEALSSLVQSGGLTREEARLGAQIPLAEDITVEADSGGHTDNRPLIVLLPAVMAVRDSIAQSMAHLPGYQSPGYRSPGYRSPIRVGAAGGLGTPAAIAGAFSMGAAYVLTGSINQGSIEADTSAEAKRLLAECDSTDIAMTAAPDMFEMGAKVQVLKRGLLYPGRAVLLYELYRSHGAIEEIPAGVRASLENEIFQMTFPELWVRITEYFRKRNASILEQAERDPKVRMALMFRWYLGQTSRWAIEGNASRRLDYQLWCGPAMGAFNEWAKGTFLALPENRSAVQIARNLMEGAAVVTRAQQFRALSVPVPETAFQFRPRHLQ